MSALRELDNDAGLVAFCFGITALPELPGPGLVALLGLFGKSPAASRSLLARLQQRGVLRGERRGRTTGYRLSGPVSEQFGRLRALGHGESPPVDSWDGQFSGVLFHAPESQRAWRDHARRTGISQGFRLLRPGLLVHPLLPAEAVLGHLAEAPEGAGALPVRLELAAADARGLVAQLWELDLLTRRVVTTTNHLAGLGEAPRSVLDPDILRYAAAMRAGYQCLLLAPQLPAELLPEQWPLPGLRNAITRTNREWTPGVQAAARSLVSAASGQPAS
ncbi:MULTISPECIES: hypothetical protein [unclassified Luteococcus]|uniref:hypothetical protein n=1 Tax=unclassified Luteococcus TaxID=2639923 RepID=UPI00313C61D7